MLVKPQGFQVGGDAAVVAGAVLAGVLLLVLVAGGVLVVRDTVRRHGRWGINLKPIECPECGEPAPVVRRPQNRRQALWGGGTCTRCGTEYDKWGRPVADERSQES